jgi:hypothetical protein
MRQFTRFAFCTVLLSPAVGMVMSVGCSDDSETGGSTNSATLSTTGSSTGSSTNVGGSGGLGGAGAGAGGNGGSSYVTGSGGGGIYLAACQGHIYECGDTVDNDGDGLIDWQDSDCLGPCDNTEGSYYGGIPGQDGPDCTVDCYFDQDSGSGNDDCHWNHQCDEHEADPDFYPEHENGTKCHYDSSVNTPGTDASCDEMYATQSDTCMNYCGPLTPNGCDCFGCCELPAGGGKYVWLGSEDAGGNGTCAIDVVDDPTLCQPCKPVAACLNDCGTCELCIGKSELPPECLGTGGAGGAGGTGGTMGAGGSGTSQCSPGVQACGLSGQAPCPTGSYCITGCCQLLPN